MQRVAFLNPIITPAQIQQAQRKSTSSLCGLLSGQRFLSSGLLSLSSRPIEVQYPARDSFRRTKCISPTNSTKSEADIKMNAGTPLKRVVIAGGSGFIGQRLTKRLISEGVEVTVLTRSMGKGGALVSGAKVVTWSGKIPAGDAESVRKTGWFGAMKGCDGVVNLCGVPIVTRWNTAGKAAITRSRVDPTQALAAAINAMEPGEQPGQLLNASGVAYYGFQDGSLTDEVSENDPIGNMDEFCPQLCRDWESAAQIASLGGTLVSVLRFGLVLGRDGGAIKQMLPAFQFFVGGPLGSGKQWVSWIHVDDVVEIIMQLLNRKLEPGQAYNCTTQMPVTMNEMCGALAAALNRPNLFAVPEIVLKTALGDASAILTASQRVLPKRLTDAGFQYRYADIKDAMQAIVRER